HGFSFDPGTTIRVRAPGYVASEDAVVNTALPTIDEVVVRLERSARIEGRVLLPDGSPAADAWVAARADAGLRESRFERTTSTDAKGTFVLDGLPPAAHFLV